MVETDDPTTDETSAPSTAWKKMCAQCILPEVSMDAMIAVLHAITIIKSITNIYDIPQRDNIFSQACLPRQAWMLATKVMDMFEQLRCPQGSKVAEESPNV